MKLRAPCDAVDAASDERGGKRLSFVPDDGLAVDAKRHGMRWVTKAPSHGRTLRESPKPRAENAHETRARCLEPSRPKRLRAEAVRRRYRAFLFRRFRRQRGSSSKSPRTPAEYMYAAKEPGPGLSRGQTNGSMSRSRNARARTDEETVWGLRACIMRTATQPLCQRAAA